MCVISIVGNYWKDQIVPNKYNEWTNFPIVIPQVTKEEFDTLRKDVLELKELLKAAITFDTNVGEPDCEKEEKVELMKAMAKAVGLSLEDLIK
jgi:hypothetical protein